jgi:hypothetical protein
MRGDPLRASQFKYDAHFDLENKAPYKRKGRHLRDGLPLTSEGEDYMPVVLRLRFGAGALRFVAVLARAGFDFAGFFVAAMMFLIW